MSEEHLSLDTAEQRRTLWIVLMLNVALAAAFGITGALADSSSLIANGLDNASDAIVYVISLLALTRSVVWKRGAARVSGVLLLLFAAGVLIDAARRYLIGSEPLGPTMIGMALAGVVVNGICLWLLKRLDEPDVNMRAATTFSLNDFISNGGIVVAGTLVLWTGRNWPDLLVGVAVAAIAIKGGVEILGDAGAEARRDKSQD
jgi:cobalt-zinc-cadmium efflux system protein